MVTIIWIGGGSGVGFPISGSNGHVHTTSLFPLKAKALTGLNIEKFRFEVTLSNFRFLAHFLYFIVNRTELQAITLDASHSTSSAFSSHGKNWSDVDSLKLIDAYQYVMSKKGGTSLESLNKADRS